MSSPLRLGPGHLLIRHGASEGNLRGIIQGRSDVYGLTGSGVLGVERQLQSHRESFGRTRQIVSSPARRAVETAAILAKALGVPCSSDVRLLEADAGILEGLSHDEAARRYPTEHAIWKGRGDLDGIEGAEAGDQLQARVITFLHRYLGASRSNEVLVAHAAFNRCLYNTVLGFPRTAPLDCDHGVVHRLPDVSKVTVTPQLRARKSTVHKLTTVDNAYILKRVPKMAPERLQLQTRVLRAIQSEHYDTPLLLALHTSEADTLRVFSHVGGIHRDGPLEAPAAVRLIAAAAAFSESLTRLSGELRGWPVLPLRDMLSSYIELLDPSGLREQAESLRNAPHVGGLLDPADATLVNLDLHRSNILFEGTRVGFIDLETFVAAPKLMQLASLLVAGFLLEDPDWRYVTQATAVWPGHVDEKKLLVLMRLRAVLGGAYFQHQLEQGRSRPQDAVLLERYCRVLSLLQEHA